MGIALHSFDNLPPGTTEAMVGFHPADTRPGYFDMDMSKIVAFDRSVAEAIADEGMIGDFIAAGQERDPKKRADAFNRINYLLGKLIDHEADRRKVRL